LLRLFDARQSGNLSDIDLEKCLKLIESFVVRRVVCAVPTNPLNKLFVQWSKNFPNTDHVQWLHRSLSAGAGNSRFPLCRLEKSFQHKETVDLSTTTIEHILPQTLTQEWKDALGLEPEKVHTNIVNIFGNLTLTSYNSELSNLPFLNKKSKLENTHIELNRWILLQSSWGVPEIEERAKSLLDIANKIWLAPLETISS
jgi:hypothetical protein